MGKLTSEEIDNLSTDLIKEFANSKLSAKEIANKYHTDLGLVMSIKQTRINDIRKAKEELKSAKEILEVNFPVPEVTKEEFVEPEIIENEIINEFNEQKRYTSDGICYEDVLDDYLSDLPVRDIIKKHGLTNARLYSILSDICGGKECIPYRRKKCDNKILDDNQIIELISDFENGELEVRELMVKYAIGVTDYYCYLAKFYGGHEAIPKRRNVKRRKSPDEIKMIKEDETNMAKKKKMSTRRNRPNTSPKSQVKPENENKFKFAGLEFEIPEVGILKKTDSTIQVGLVSDRHDIYDITNYIFKTLTETELSDFDYQYCVANIFMQKTDFSGKTLVLYCTGCQSALAATIKAAYDNNIDLILMHYNPTRKTYDQQMIWNFHDIKSVSWPFSRLDERFEKIYGYNTTVEKLIDAETTYALSLNVFSEETKAYIDKDTITMLFTDEDEAWKEYREFVKVIHGEDVTTKNSVILNTVYIKNNYFSWGDTITKSYNYSKFD